MTKSKLKKKQKLRNAEYYDFQNILDDLYENSKKGIIFNKLMKLISSRENIILAYRNIKKNRGSKTSGVDNKTIKDLSKWKDDKLVDYIIKRLAWYNPQPVKRVEIRKENGGIRPLGIPTIMDRLIQQCILQILEPICEAKFHDRNNGFRPNRSTEHAIAQSYKFIQKSNLHHVIDIDIKGFFDNVSHGKLLKQLWTLGIRDKKLISIISTMLKAEVAGIGFPSKGTPQGGIISPLLSNIVLNEFDWWISSQWESMITKKSYKCGTNKSGSPIKSGIYRALRTTRLKECYIVRYADDFKIFCSCRKDAKKLFIAIKDWLKNRLGLEISPEKSKIINLKKKYSEFLGFRLKVRKKGKYLNGKPKYVVCSNVKPKNIKRIYDETKRRIKDIQHTDDNHNEYKAVQAYNSYILGIHNYYKIASNINLNLAKIVFTVYRTLQIRLKSRLKRTGNTLPNYIKERYGKSKQLRFVNGLPIIPIGFIQTSYPRFKKRVINSYTREGRKKIHKELSGVNMGVIRYLMKNPVLTRSIEYNDNRISLYCAQKGKCAITGEILEIGKIHCHHKNLLQNGGTDKYKNLILIKDDIHRLIHASEHETIQKYVKLFNLDKNKKAKVNRLRNLVRKQPI